MTNASSHYKEMKNLMRTKIFMVGIKNRKLQRINNSSYCINNSSCQKPSKPCRREGMYNRNKSKYAQPAHSNINYRRKPLGACNPACFYNNSDNCRNPHSSTQQQSCFSFQNNQTNRCICLLYTSDAADE